MRIDDAWDDGPALRIDRMFCFDVELSDCRDAVAFDCDVSLIGVQSRTVNNDGVLNRYVMHNENYNAARQLNFKSKSLARRGAWRSQSQSAPGRRRDLLSCLIEHQYPPAQVPVNGLLPQPRRRAVRHGSCGQQGIEQRLLVSVGNLQSYE